MIQLIAVLSLIGFSQSSFGQSILDAGAIAATYSSTEALLAETDEVGLFSRRTPRINSIQNSKQGLAGVNYSDGQWSSSVLTNAWSATAETSSEKVSIELIKFDPAPVFVTIEVAHASSSLEVSCMKRRPVYSGTSSVSGLTVDGVPVAVTGETNQLVDLPQNLGQIILNEEIISLQGPNLEYKRNALRVIPSPDPEGQPIAWSQLAYTKGIAYCR